MLLPVPSDPAQIDDVDGARFVLSVHGSVVTYLIESYTCEMSPRPRVYETATAVVVGATAEPLGHGICGTVGKEVPATVTLKSPLGTRPLLDIDSGAVLQALSGYFQGT